MPKLPYHHVDVFTDRLFGGNQLAVFPDGRGLSTELMQQIAQEMNFSETAFVFPPQATQNHFKLRIFTPAAEIPMAGHPTIGTAFVLQHIGMVTLHESQQSIRFEEGVGPITVTYQQVPDKSPLITMQQPLPVFGAIFEDKATLAALLSIEPSQLHPDYPAQVVSSGVPFLYIVVKDLEVIHKVRLRQEVWEQHFQHGANPHIFVLMPKSRELNSNTVRSRMFGPAFGIAEDPATGSASGPLGAYLVNYGIVAAAETVKIVSEQGFEMGRPSLIHITLTMEGKRLQQVEVGGYSVYVSEGILHL